MLSITTWDVIDSGVGVGQEEDMQPALFGCLVDSMAPEYDSTTDAGLVPNDPTWVVSCICTPNEPTPRLG